MTGRGQRERQPVTGAKSLGLDENADEHLGLRGAIGKRRRGEGSVANLVAKKTVSRMFKKRRGVSLLGDAGSMPHLDLNSRHSHRQCDIRPRPPPRSTYLNSIVTIAAVLSFMPGSKPFILRPQGTTRFSLELLHSETAFDNLSDTGSFYPTTQ